MQLMKNQIPIYITILAFFITTGCNNSGFGELRGVRGRGKWTEPTPYGMNFINQGSFNLGPSEQDVTGMLTRIKTVSVDAFWMDDTEITNNEYRQFVFWVRDLHCPKIIRPAIPGIFNYGRQIW